MNFIRKLIASLLLSLLSACVDINQPSQPGILLQLLYSVQQSQSNIQIQTITIYSNNTLNNSFYAPNNFLNCANTQLFTLNQDLDTDNYTLLLSNFSQAVIMQLYIGYNNPVLLNSTCQGDPCTIDINTNCTNDYSNNFVLGQIQTQSGNINITFQYYTQCNYSTTNTAFFIQWGYVLIIFLSIGAMWVSSKFQQARSFNNFTVFIGYIFAIVYGLLCILKFMLFFEKVPNIMQVANAICTFGAFVFGITSVEVCFCQLLYYTKVQYFRKYLFEERIKIRVMDVLGIFLGIGLCCAWFFSSNAIISDFIFFIIYLALMKIVKFGSLKIAILLFFINFIVYFSFYNTAGIISNPYTNSQYTYFNNPLFLQVPEFAHIPNRSCAWFSIITLSFQGFILCYLQRLDKNKSSQIYGPIFVGSFVIGCFAWILICYLARIALPLDLFIIPIAVLILFFFAYRRGQFPDLWTGEFYDEQKVFYDNMSQMKSKLKTENNQPFKNNLFENLQLQETSFDKKQLKQQRKSVISEQQSSMKKTENSQQARKTSKSDMNFWFQKMTPF